MLIESTHETWSALRKQSLEGQLRAVDMYMRGYHKKNQKRISDGSWKDLLVASGMWAKIVDKFLLAILFNPELITTLRSEFLHLPDFRTDIVQMASKEPPLVASAFGDIASWFVQSVARLRRAKQQFETNFTMVGDSMPGSIMAAAEVSGLSHIHGQHCP